MTLVPRTWAVRQALEAWGQQQATLPLFVEQPGRTKGDAGRRGHGQRVIRHVEVEYSDGRVALQARRFVVVQSSQLAPQPSQTDAIAQQKAAEAVPSHVPRVQAQWFAWEADAEAAIAEDEHRGPGRRGRRPHPWRYHVVRSRVVAATRRPRRPRRGRPAKTAPLPRESGYRLRVAVEALAHPEADHGWTVRATTVRAEACTEAEILQADQEQHTTVEPGVRWSKNPAAISPVWLATPERIAAWARLTVLGRLVYSMIPRQVRLSLRTYDQQIPGNKGATATPTAAVVLSVFASVALVQLFIGEPEVDQGYGLHSHHLLRCDALGLDDSWDQVPSAQKNAKGMQTP